MLHHQQPASPTWSSHCSVFNNSHGGGGGGDDGDDAREDTTHKQNHVVENMKS